MSALRGGVAVIATAVSLRGLLLAASATMTGMGLASLQGWPAWAITIVALIPWIPVFVKQAISLDDGWMSLFYVLVVTQTGHLLEHLAQMTQIHTLHRHGAAARGIFGNLDIEWVHIIWNAWVLVAAVLLLVHFRRNGWLVATVLIAGWHTIEHVYIMSVYLRSGVAGSPGLLSRGGSLGGGLEVTRPDLHFLYNVIETLPLLLAFFVQSARRTDEGARGAPFVRGTPAHEQV